MSETTTNGSCTVRLDQAPIWVDYTPSRSHDCLLSWDVQWRLRAMFGLGVFAGLIMVAWAWAAWQQIQQVV